MGQGENVNALDEEGKSPLHWAAANGHVGTVSALINAGADPGVRDDHGMTPFDYANANGHSQTADEIARAIGNEGSRPPSASEAATPSGLNPSLKYVDLPSFETAIGQPACLLKSDRVWMFAPKSREEAANVVFRYLVNAYDVLRGIVGVDTEFVIVVYNFPEGSREAFGGTSNCAIYYDDTNLQLDRHSEWTLHSVPHVSGYIEEMAHNFVAATKAQFGWEMMGWSIGMHASQAVASNPVFVQHWTETYQGQASTYQRYVAAGFVLPSDVPANQVDRIHAYILSECERQYGASFWRDAFAEIRKEAQALRDAANAGEDDAIRNKRYQITIECLDRLPGIEFKQMLQNSGISLTTDVKSLHPTEPGWNRRLQ
ncbi:MAG: hypothetical protein AMXMBFR82_35580 [Candidatus Hydrogenedentota bacterium]